MIEDILCRNNFVDLGSEIPELSGIFSPAGVDSKCEKYIHEMFLDGAASYASRYTHEAFWKSNIQEAIRFLDIHQNSKLNILDLGSGAGNSVFPLLELFPNSHVFASDLSLPMLKILQKVAQDRGKSRNCTILEMNAEEITFKSNELDLVVGVAILHHLFAPDRTIFHCSRILKQGGGAIFFEPFELGNMLIARFLQDLIDRNSRESIELPTDIEKFFSGHIRHLKDRQGTDKSAQYFQKMEDKWLFNRSYFEDLAEKYGYSDLMVFPIGRGANFFSNRVNVILRLALGKNLTDLPDWANAAAREMDQFFSKELDNELTVSSGVVFIK